MLESHGKHIHIFKLTNSILHIVSDASFPLVASPKATTIAEEPLPLLILTLPLCSFKPSPSTTAPFSHVLLYLIFPSSLQTLSLLSILKDETKGHLYNQQALHRTIFGGLAWIIRKFKCARQVFSVFSKLQYA